MKSFLILLIGVFLILPPAHTQITNKPADLLSVEFHKGRRAELRKKLPTNSVAVFFANAIRNRAHDVDYDYHPDPNFYYLTGYREPHAVLFIFKDNIEIDGKQVNELIFVRERNALRELYDGTRLGKDGAMKELGFALAYEGPEFEEFNIDFSRFDKVLFYDFYNDVRDTPADGDLFDLIAQFKQKVGYMDNPNTLTIEPTKNNIDLVTLDTYMMQMRGIKSEEELILLRKAVNISTAAQAEVMKAIEPGMSEMEIQGLHEYIHKMYNAEEQGYGSIVGAGHNGCFLHYMDNYKPAVEDGELILMDVGAEYRGYTADVTRTIPVNGKFTPEQKIIYDLVFKAQEAVWEICKEGTTFQELSLKTNEVLVNGLVELGIYKSNRPEDIINPDTGRPRYNPHGCCHHIGLDVHDKGERDQLKEGMVITIEPGIYIRKGDPVEERWWDIPVRIEDDFLIKKDGCELLSDMAPRQSDEIEEFMKQSSPIRQLKLPDIDGK